MYRPNKAILALFLFYTFVFLGSGAYAANIPKGSGIPITVTEKSGNDLKDYQVLIKLDENNFSFSFDREEISFSDEKGNKLNFWIEEWEAQQKKARIWVKLLILKAGESQIIYLNQNGSGKSDGQNTFDFFDDFDDGNYSDNPAWMVEQNCTFNGGSVGVGSDVPHSKALVMTRQSSSCGAGITSRFNGSYFGIWHASIKKSAGSDGNGVHYYLTYNNNEDFYALDINSDGVKLFGPGWRQIGSTYRQEVDKWHDYEIVRDPKGNWTVFIDGVARIAGTNNSSKNNSKIGVRTISWTGSTTDYADNIYFRKYANPEPEVSLGDDIAISSDDLIVTKTDETGYAIKGTVFSSFKEDKKNIEVAIYDRDPMKDPSAKELSRFEIDNVGSLKETDFEMSLNLSSASNGLYFYADPDHALKETNQINNVAYTDKIRERNILDTILPFLANILMFLAIFLIIIPLYGYLKGVRRSASNPSGVHARTKTCLKCGMVTDQMKPRCPVCSSEMFK